MSLTLVSQVSSLKGLKTDWNWQILASSRHFSEHYSLKWVRGSLFVWDRDIDSSLLFRMPHSYSKSFAYWELNKDQTNKLWLANDKKIKNVTQFSPATNHVSSMSCKNRPNTSQPNHLSLHFCFLMFSDSLTHTHAFKPQFPLYMIQKEVIKEVNEKDETSRSKHTGQPGYKWISSKLNIIS